MSLDWLIVGGGLHGVHLALALLGSGKAERSGLRLLDPHPKPLARWRQRSASVGMRFMRSPSVHHLDGPPFSLTGFAREGGFDKRDFRAPYNRPSTRLFDAHCDALVRDTELDELCLRGSAVDVFETEEGLEVHTETERIATKRVVLALGSARLARPDWALELARAGIEPSHVFEDDFDTEGLTDGVRVAVVGGGISAAQLAVRLTEEATGPITLMIREPLREAQFDSDPGWLGPIHLEAFRKESDLGQRRAMITGARNRGTVPRDVLKDVRRAQRSGKLAIVETDIAEARVDRHGIIELWPRSGSIVRTDRVVLATGFAPERPGAWLEPAIERMGLPLAPCGYPIVDRALRWHRRIHVSGPLAELELGPASRNIAGARMAAARLLEHLMGRSLPPPRARIVRLGSV